MFVSILLDGGRKFRYLNGWYLFLFVLGLDVTDVNHTVAIMVILYFRLWLPYRSFIGGCEAVMEILCWSLWLVGRRSYFFTFSRF